MKKLPPCSMYCTMQCVCITMQCVLYSMQYVLYTRNAYSMYCITKKPPTVLLYCIRMPTVYESHEDRQYSIIVLYEEAAATGSRHEEACSQCSALFTLWRACDGGGLAKTVNAVLATVEDLPRRMQCVLTLWRACDWRTCEDGECSAY